MAVLCSKCRSIRARIDIKACPACRTSVAPLGENEIFSPLPKDSADFANILIGRTWFFKNKTAMLIKRQEARNPATSN